MIEAPIDPWPPFTFCCPQAIVDQDAGVSIPNISLLPLDEAPVHAPLRRPRPFAIRKAPSARVESIEPRPPQPCEVGRSKGRRRKSRRQSHKFFKHLLRLVLTRARCVSSSLLLSCKASLGTKSLPVLGGKCLGRSLRTIGAKKLAFFVEHLFPSSTQQCLNV